MREIGGYIELDHYDMPMLHDGATALNCGRNALAFLLQVKGIRKVRIPRFLCNSVLEGCMKGNAEVHWYSVGIDFLPAADVKIDNDEWLYVVNYYGQVTNKKLQELAGKYGRIIVDNAQAYFQKPLAGVDTLYTCRKYFGVADGAFLYTDAPMEIQIPQDESFDRMRFLLGRFERSASEFYGEYTANNRLFVEASVKRMSKLTDNLLRAIDYEAVRQKRTQNFRMLHAELGEINQLNISIPDGAFMYPLYIRNGAEIRKTLQTKRIFIPTLWPDVFERCAETDLEYDMARNILPLPVDQRYGREEMQYIAEVIKQCIS